MHLSLPGGRSRARNLSNTTVAICGQIGSGAWLNMARWRGEGLVNVHLDDLVHFDITVIPCCGTLTIL